MTERIRAALDRLAPEQLDKILDDIRTDYTRVYLAADGTFTIQWFGEPLADQNLTLVTLEDLPEEYRLVVPDSPAELMGDGA